MFEDLDTGSELPKPFPENRSILSLSAAQCLLQFLGSLPDALAPVFLHPRCANISNRDDAFEVSFNFEQTFACQLIWLTTTSSCSTNFWASLSMFVDLSLNPLQRDSSITPGLDCRNVFFALHLPTEVVSRLCTSGREARCVLYFCTSVMCVADGSWFSCHFLAGSIPNRQI